MPHLVRDNCQQIALQEQQSPHHLTTYYHLTLDLLDQLPLGCMETHSERPWALFFWTIKLMSGYLLMQQLPEA